MRPWPWAVLALLIGLVPDGVGHADEPPAVCPKPTPHHTGAVEPLFAMLRIDRLERLRAEFSEAKRITLLARPLRSTGTLYFERTRGIARLTRSPGPERIVLSTTTLRIEKAGKVEEVPLDKSKALRGFAQVFPALLRADRAALEATFDLELDGAPHDAWSLALFPKDPGLCGLLRRVVVSGQGPEVRALQVEEASGDTTDTRLSAITRNGAVPPTEIAKAFGVP